MATQTKSLTFMNFLMIALLGLFITSFLFSLKLQKDNENSTNIFYQRISWYASKLIIHTKEFGYVSTLYESKAITFDEYKSSYEMLWSRLDTFLSADEIDSLRQSYPSLTQKVTNYFELIQSMEPDFEQPNNLSKPEFLSKLKQSKELSKPIGELLQPIVFGKLNQEMKTNTQLIQIWQLLSFILSILLAVIFLIMTKRASHLAKHDSLTKLGNRRALQETMKNMFEQGRSLAVMSIDLKKFKIVNDQIGYQVGDRVLTVFAEKLGQINGYTPFRMGGDEFVLLSVFRGSVDTLQARTQHVKDLLTFSFKTREFIFPVEIRLGVSFGNKDDNISADELLDQSVMALNECKVAKNDLVMYHEIVPILVKNKQKSQILTQYVSTQEGACPLLICLTPLYNESNGEKKVQELSLLWKKDNSQCTLSWLAEERIDLKILPPILEKACQSTAYLILLKLSHTYQIEQLMNTEAKLLLQKQRVIIGLPLLSGLTDDQIELIEKYDLAIAVETMHSDEYAKLPNLNNLRYWVPKTLPITEDKFKALVSLATAYEQITLVNSAEESDMIIELQ